VDDDPSVRKSVGHLLESAGIDVRTFAEPEIFLDYVSKNRVDVAILDIWMEHITGMELLAHLCATSPHTRLIFITGHQDTAAEATVTQAGVFAFFLKPFDEQKFLNTVQAALDAPANILANPRSETTTSSLR
jgi:FixJ family two-component response regulator